MADQTWRILLQKRADVNYLFFVFFATICSYNFHWYLTSGSLLPSPRIGWLEKNRYIHAVLFVTGLAGAAIFFFFLLPHWHWLLIAAVITFFYSAPKIPNRYFRLLRKIALGKTIFLAFVWMYVTTVLPVIISDQEWNTGFVLFAIGRFFFIFTICILFDYRDRQDDQAAGIRSLITYLNDRQILNMFTFSFLIFVVSTALLYSYDYKISIIIVLLIPGFIAASLFNYARRNFSDILYYFVLDGLLALSALLMLIPGI